MSINVPDSIEESDAGFTEAEIWDYVKKLKKGKIIGAVELWGKNIFIMEGIIILSELFNKIKKKNCFPEVEKANIH